MRKSKGFGMLGHLYHQSMSLKAVQWESGGVELGEASFAKFLKTDTG